MPNGPRPYGPKDHGIGSWRRRRSRKTKLQKEFADRSENKGLVRNFCTDARMRASESGGSELELTSAKRDRVSVATGSLVAGGARNAVGGRAQEGR